MQQHLNKTIWILEDAASHGGSLPKYKQNKKKMEGKQI